MSNQHPVPPHGADTAIPDTVNPDTVNPDTVNSANAATNFVNAPIVLADLPRLDALKFQQVDRRWLKMQMISWLIIATVGLIITIVLAVTTDAAALAVAAPLLIGLVIGTLGALLETRAFRHRGWQLRTHDISSRRGLIGRRTTTAPFTRVQHVTVSQSGISRLFDVAELNVFTAGAGVADLEIAGLRPDDAEQLKAQILERSQA